MSALMVLSFMPAMAFAEDSAQNGAGNDAAGITEDEFGVVVSPVEVKPAVDLYGIVGTNELSNELYEKGNGFIVKYDDGSEKEFWYETRTFEQGGETFEVSAFFPKEKESDNLYYLDAYYTPDEDQLFFRGENTVTLDVYPPYYVNGEGSLGTKYIPVETKVWCQYGEPVSLEFKPAEGFQAEGFIGNNIIFEDSFYGEGNMFTATVRYIGWNSETEKYDLEWDTVYDYKYSPVNPELGIEEEGFYAVSELPNGKEYIDPKSRLDLGYCGEVSLSPGINTVELDYITTPTGTIDTFVVDFTVTMKAEKYDVYSNFPAFEYTGKAVSTSEFNKQLVIRDSEGKKIPSIAYTYRLPSTRDIGFHEMKVKFDTELYPEFPESITVNYRIGPKVPQIKSVQGGKNQLTVKWDKLKASQLKNIDGMYIEIATNKSFTSNYNAISLNDDQTMKGSKVIKKLKKNKKYYVKVSTFKKIKDTEYGGNYYVFSPDSKVKTGKTKK